MSSAQLSNALAPFQRTKVEQCLIDADYSVSAINRTYLPSENDGSSSFASRKSRKRSREVSRIEDAQSKFQDIILYFNYRDITPAFRALADHKFYMRLAANPNHPACGDLLNAIVEYRNIIKRASNLFERDENTDACCQVLNSELSTLLENYAQAIFLFEVQTGSQ